jgi:hypothetical protein
MKHYHLKKAIEKAKAAGLKVVRHFSGSRLTVTVSDRDGRFEEKSYTAGNASGQARFIDGSIGKLKGFRLVETGKLYRFESGDIFQSDKFKTVYAWNHEEKQWQSAGVTFKPSLYAVDADQILNVKVDCKLLFGGIRHPDW